MVCNVILCAVTLLTLQLTKLRYIPQKARGQASGARRRADGSPQGQDRRLALGLGSRQPSPEGARHNTKHQELIEPRVDRASEASHLKRKDHKSYAAPSRRRS